MAIEGKVAAVLNERELAINIGTKSGVKVGMKFKVLADKPTDITDPATGEPLGQLDREKVRVQVVAAEDKFAVCRTYRIRYAGIPAFSFPSISALMYPREVQETLKAKDAEVPPPLSEEESYVKKGDRVVELSGDDK